MLLIYVDFVLFYIILVYILILFKSLIYFASPRNSSYNYIISTLHYSNQFWFFYKD